MAFTFLVVLDPFQLLESHLWPGSAVPDGADGGSVRSAALGDSGRTSPS